jgi:hypothetical protein
MQYDRVHEYMEARSHTRESYVEAFCDKVRVFKMRCTYKDWCNIDEAKSSTAETNNGPVSSLPAWDMDRPLLQPLCELLEELCEKGNKFCQVVVMFEENSTDLCNEIQFSAYFGRSKRLNFSKPHTVLVCVPLLINMVSKETTAEVPFLYTRCHTDRGYREYMSYIYNNGSRFHCWVQAAIFDDTPITKGDDIYTSFSEGPIGQAVCVKTDTPEFTHTKLRDSRNNPVTEPTFATGHLGCVAKFNPDGFRRLPPWTHTNFSQRFLRIFAIGRWWYLITKSRLCNVTLGQTNGHAKMFGHPFWSLTLCDRLQNENDMNDFFHAFPIDKLDNFRYDFETFTENIDKLDNLRHDFETASKTVESDDVNLHMNAHTVAMAPYTAILKTQVKVMRLVCEVFKKRIHTCYKEELQCVETMETLLKKNLTQLDTIDTDFQDEIDEKISTAVAYNELYAHLGAIRAEYMTEIASLREALERQQTQHNDTLQASHIAEVTQLRQDIKSAAETRLNTIRAEYTTEIASLREALELQQTQHQEALELQQSQHREAIAQFIRRFDRLQSSSAA